MFVSHSPLGVIGGKIAAKAVALVFGCLLLSAVNTAIVDLIAISFLMSRDGELPASCQKLNKFGVPTVGMVVATVIPAILVIAVKDMNGLADLYAVGVVGAIATNLGASGTDRKLGLATWERVLMLGTFCIMFAIEVTLFVTKPGARVFTITVLVIGLILRGLASESSRRKAARDAAASAEHTQIIVPKPSPTLHLTGAPLLCAVRSVGRTLDFAIEEARETRRALYLLFVRVLPVITEADQGRKWQDDEEARAIFAHAFGRPMGTRWFPATR